ncbi:MAG: ATP-binding protein [Thermoguttaceae bacterium]
MASINLNWTKSYVIASSIDLAHSLIDEIMKQLGETLWSQKELFAINLALEEALVNAVQHGNKSDPTKKVRVDCRLSNDNVFFRVEDEGPGFDPDQVPDPTDAEHIMIASGRGVLLIRGFVSRAEWIGCGNILEFEKNRDLSQN